MICSGLSINCAAGEIGINCLISFKIFLPAWPQLQAPDKVGMAMGMTAFCTVR